MREELMLSLYQIPERISTTYNQESEWQNFFKEGSQFLSLAEKGAKNRKKFNAEALYNLLAMAIEKHFMALFLYHNYMPEGHTLQDMLSAATQFIRVDMELIKGIAFMDSMQEICSVDDFTKKAPTDDEIERMVEIAYQVKECVGNKVH